MINIIVYLILDTVKRVGDGDLKLKIPNVCITKKEVMEKDQQSLANICLKLNTKLAEINYRISLESWYRFFFV